MSTSKPAHSVPAVAYLRRSTDKQEASIPEQRKAVQQYADDKGYKTIRWYVDDAISGDDTANRKQFLQMLADAQSLADFKAILCWEQGRFGRFNPHEASYYTWPLAKAGIQLVTVDKGPIDWNDFTTWLTYSVNQHAKHDYIVSLSRDVTRGLKEAAEQGGWIGSPPYAYRTEGPKKNKRLVIDDHAKAKIVQRIFREFVVEGRAMMNIADRLNDEGVVSPGGRIKGWRYDSVKVILENPAYTGDFAPNRSCYGKYHVIDKGKVAKSDGKRHRRPKEEWNIRRDHHEPIIDRATYEQAQVILEKAKLDFAEGQIGRSPYTPETNPFVLSRLLRCGRCGCALRGMRGGSHKQENRPRYYECGNRKYNGPDACEGTTVREDRVLQSIADYLDGWLGLDGDWIDMAAQYGALQADDLPQAFAEVRKLVAPPTKPKVERKRLEQQADQLTARLAKARANLVELDAENIPAAQERIRQLDQQRVGLERELEQYKPQAEKDINTVALMVLNNLYALARCCRIMAMPACFDAKGNRGVMNADGSVTWGSLQSAAPQAVRWLLSHASHIVCHTAVEGQGNGRRHVFQGGEIVYNVVGLATGNLNPHHAG